MLFLPAQVLKGGFVTSWTPYMPSLVFEQKYLCRKCILWGTGISSTPRRACPEQAPRWLGSKLCLRSACWISALQISGAGANSVLVPAGEEERGKLGKPHWDCPPWSPTEAHQSPLHTGASPGLAGMLWLLLCEDSRSWHTNTMNCSLLLGVGLFFSGMFLIWVYCLGFY